MNNHKINWIHAILAGVVGTIAFDILGFIFSGQWFSTAQLIANKTELGMAYGLFGHYSNWILLAILYAGIAPSLPGSPFFRAQLFAIAETIALIWFFVFSLSGIGIAGLDKSIMVPIESFVKHVAYGVSLWYFIHKFKGFSKIR